MDGGGIFSCNQHPPAGVFTAISVGDQLACAVRADGALLCWTNSGETPDAAPSGTFVDVSLDKENDGACAVGTDGHVVFWSFAVPPQISDGPMQIVQQGGEVCVLDKTGMVQCVSGYVATIPLPTGPFTEIAIGSAHVYGLRSDGHVTCTGTDAVAGLTPPHGALHGDRVRSQLRVRSDRRGRGRLLGRGLGRRRIDARPRSESPIAAPPTAEQQGALLASEFTPR